MRAHRFPHRRPTEWNVLLLVLILVLIAFGLLVVAVLSGSVLWPWVSVGVSVAAAAVLLVHWLHRRSAVKAGAEEARMAASSMPRPMVRGGLADLEPATEVIPKVPPLAPDAQLADAGDSVQTVALPAVKPPGSAERPSSATAQITSSGPDSSQSVTETAEGHTTGSPTKGDGGETPAGAVGHPGGGSGSAGDESAASEPADRSTAHMLDAARTAEAEAAGPAPAGGEPGAGGGPGSSPGTAPPGSSSDAPAVADGGVAPQQSQVPGGGAEQAGAAQGAGAQGAQGAPLPPLGPDGAPPEEPRDPDAASVVAGLEDEVLVIDELPRYHLFGCRSLLGRPVIPLPAREAVELGFTPCGWCTPDRALSARHHAGAR